MLVNPRIEHVDPSTGDDSTFIEITDITDEKVQFYFTDMAALYQFVKDLGIVVEGANPDAQSEAHTPTLKRAKISLFIH